MARYVSNLVLLSLSLSNRLKSELIRIKLKWQSQIFINSIHVAPAWLYGEGGRRAAKGTGFGWEGGGGVGGR